jgi:hypothetical protein
MTEEFLDRVLRYYHSHGCRDMAAAEEHCRRADLVFDRLHGWEEPRLPDDTPRYSVEDRRRRLAYMEPNRQPMSPEEKASLARDLGALPATGSKRRSVRPPLEAIGAENPADLDPYADDSNLTQEQLDRQLELARRITQEQGLDWPSSLRKAMDQIKAGKDRTPREELTEPQLEQIHAYSLRNHCSLDEAEAVLWG